MYLPLNDSMHNFVNARKQIETEIEHDGDHVSFTLEALPYFLSSPIPSEPFTISHIDVQIINRRRNFHVQFLVSVVPQWPLSLSTVCGSFDGYESRRHPSNGFVYVSLYFFNDHFIKIYSTHFYIKWLFFMDFSILGLF